jgi:Tfp pilus assembly protein PilZ
LGYDDRVGAVRLELRLTSQSEWIKIFDPRDWTMFVPTADPAEQGATLRIDLDVGGWLVTLRGTVVGHREDPTGVVVALGGSERDKINYLNGFVRGGLLNLREKRRLPIRLQVTYGAVEGPANTFTKDINEEGLFLFTDKPLPETSQIHMLVAVPGKEQPLSLMGKVSHTILADDEEPPGMGIVFELDDTQRAALIAVIRELEAMLLEGKLPTTSVE